MRSNEIFIIIEILCFSCLGILACTDMGQDKLYEHQDEVFIDVTEEAALNHVRDSYSHCWGDINGDGLQDIFIINHIAPPSLFRNSGDGTFVDITSLSGLMEGGDLHGCAIADYDNDGDQDIYVTLGAGRGMGVGLNRLYQNNGKGIFKDVAAEAGITDPKGRGRSASWIDYNNDGFLDLFVANDKRSDAPSVLFKNNWNGTFTDVSAESSLNIVDTVTEASWIDYDNDGFMDLTVAMYRKHLKGEIRIYKNMESGIFQMLHTISGRSYAWGDYDNDGDMDLLIINPPRVHILGHEIGILSKFFKGYIKLYENTGGDRFVDVSNKSGFKDQMGGNKAIFFDYDNDGNLDIYMLVSGSRSNNINDIIFRNNGDKTFTDVTKMIDLNQNFIGRGSGVAFALIFDIFVTEPLGQRISTISALVAAPSPK